MALIGCPFKRPKAPVELLNPPETYFFVPIDPNNPNSEHVAEVKPREHVTRLLQIGYYLSDAAESAAATARTAAAQLTNPAALVPPPVAPAPVVVPTAAPVLDPVVEAAADASIAAITGDAGVDAVHISSCGCGGRRPAGRKAADYNQRPWRGQARLAPTF